MKNLQKAAALFLAATMTIGVLGGCASNSLRGVKKEDYRTLTVATIEGEPLTLGEVDYYLRNMQYLYEAIYGSYYGSEMWEQEAEKNKTLGDVIKEEIVNKVYQISVLNREAKKLGLTLSEEDNAKIEEAITEYLETTPEKVLTETNLNSEELRAIYERNAIANLVWEELVKDVDTEVSDEEAMQRKVTIMALNDASTTYQSEELKDEILAMLEEGKTMAEIAEEKELTASPYTLGDGDYAETFGETAMALEADEFEAIHTESGYWYIVYCDNTYDEAATENKKASIVSERQAEAFKEAYAKIKAEAPAIEVDEGVLALLTFEEEMYVAETVVPETTQSSTEE